MSFCRKLQNAIDANMELTKEDREVRCWFFDKPLPDTYLMRSEMHLTRARKVKICQRKTVRYPIFLEWHNSEMFAVLPKDCYLLFVSMPEL